MSKLTADLYNLGLFETLSFQGLDEANYWFMKGDYLFHRDLGSGQTHKKFLDHTISLLQTSWIRIETL